MANLAENTAATLFTIVDPMIRGEKSSVDSILQRERLCNGRQKLFHLDNHGREAPVVAHHKNRALRLRKFKKNRRNLVQLTFLQAQGFFAEDVFAGPQS